MSDGVLDVSGAPKGFINASQVRPEKVPLVDKAVSNCRFAADIVSSLFIIVQEEEEGRTRRSRRMETYQLPPS